MRFQRVVLEFHGGLRAHLLPRETWDSSLTIEWSTLGGTGNCSGRKAAEGRTHFQDGKRGGEAVGLVAVGVVLAVWEE